MCISASCSFTEPISDGKSTLNDDFGLTGKKEIGLYFYRMQKTLRLTALLGALAVGIGAFGAHG
ncbi:MAG: hypothetical protein AAGA62_02230, partial [Bacteroidota bacterium]